MSETKERRTVVKKVKHATLYSDGTIRLENVRASYPHVCQAQENTAEDGSKTFSYSIQGLMPKETHRAAKDLCKEVIDGILKTNKIKAVAADKKFIKDGDSMAKEETEGMWVISTRESNRPMLRGNKNDPATGKPRKLDPVRDRDVIYGGCYVNILIRPWFQNNKYGKRVNAGIAAVQFYKDGEPFGTGRIRDEDVDDTFEGEDGDDGGWTEGDDDTDGL